MPRKKRDAPGASQQFECLLSTPAAPPQQPAIYHQLIKTWGPPEDGSFDHTSVHVAVLRDVHGEFKPLGFGSVLWIYSVQGAVELQRDGEPTVTLNDAHPALERSPAGTGVRARVVEAPAVLILFCSDDPGGPIKTPPPKNQN